MADGQFEENDKRMWMRLQADTPGLGYCTKPAQGPKATPYNTGVITAPRAFRDWSNSEARRWGGGKFLRGRIV